MIKNITLFAFLVTGMGACASYAPLEQIPVKNEDFKLPPQSLLSKFPEIAAHHHQYVKETRKTSGNTVKGSLPELTKKWGFPKKSRKEMSNALVAYGYAPMFNALIFWPYFEYIIPLSAIEMMAIGPTKEVKWQKGNYIIDASFSGRGRNYLIDWKWHYVDEQGKQMPLIQEAIKRWYVGLSVSRGYELLNNDVDPGEMKLGRGGELTFGREFAAWRDDLSWETRLAFKLHGDGINESGQRLMYLRSHWDLGLRYHFSNNRISTGLALVVDPVPAYKLSNRSYLATDFDYELMKPAVGASVDIQYRRHFNTAVFLRAEFIQFKSKSSSDSIDGSNVAMGMRYYF